MRYIPEPALGKEWVGAVDDRVSLPSAAGDRSHAPENGYLRDRRKWDRRLNATADNKEGVASVVHDGPHSGERQERDEPEAGQAADEEPCGGNNEGREATLVHSRDAEYEEWERRYPDDDPRCLLRHS